jgi:SulP family sulfate permease
MAQMVEVSAGVPLRLDDEVDPGGDAGRDGQRSALPPGVEVFRIRGPLFFGAANRLDNLLDRMPKAPKVFILRMGLVPFIDASGVHALQALAERCRRQGIALILSGLQPQPLEVTGRMSHEPLPGDPLLAVDFATALAMARERVGPDLVEDIAGI